MIEMSKLARALKSEKITKRLSLMNEKP